MNEARQIVPAPSHRLPARIGDGSAGGHDRLDLTESIAFFRRRLSLILTILALCVAAGVAYSLLTPKIYTAKTSVMLTNDAESGVGAVNNTEARQTLSNELLETQVEIVTSREMAERVAAGLNLGAGLDPAELRNIVDELQEEVSAERVGKSYSLTIGYSAPDPVAAARVANEFAKQFTSWELISEQARHAEARDVVQQRLGELRDQAHNDTQALQQYRIANNLLTTSGASLTEQEISNYNQEVTRARAEAAEDQARLATALAQLSSGSSGDDVGEALGSTVISSLRLQEAQAATEVANLGSKYGSNHPQLIQAKSKLAKVQEQIQSEIGRVVSNLRAKQNVSAQRLASLTASLGTARGNLSQNNAAMVGLSDLERAAESSRGIYETYLNRYKELLAAEGSEKPNARILTVAEVPFLPEEPNIPLNIALSLVIGLGLGVLAAYIAEAAFHGISTPDELEDATGERFLTSIPLLQSVEPHIRHAITAIQDAPNSAFAESFRALDTSMGQVTRGDNQIIAITSSLPQEGKTVISCCLSYILAQSGKRTMLIDCDIRRAGLSRLLDIRRYEHGLIEVLKGEAQFDDEEFSADRMFCVLPLRPSEEQPEHLLTGKPFEELLEKLRPHFDHIILDLPPVLPVASAPILASRADATLVVARWRETSRFALRAALRRLPTDHVNIVGIALNQVDMRKRAFFERGDPSFYYDQYREYYA